MGTTKVRKDKLTVRIGGIYKDDNEFFDPQEMGTDAHMQLYNELYMIKDKSNVFSDNFIGPKLSDRFVPENQRALIIEKFNKLRKDKEEEF